MFTRKSGFNTAESVPPKFAKHWQHFEKAHSYSSANRCSLQSPFNFSASFRLSHFGSTLSSMDRSTIFQVLHSGLFSSRQYASREVCFFFERMRRKTSSFSAGTKM